MSGRGSSWERQLELWHRDYRRDQVAFVVKCNPPIRVLPHGKFAWRGKGPPDFFGVAGGRAVCFDAKDCNTKRWPFKDGRASLKPHQARDLEANQVNGGTSFVALRFNGKPWVLPWILLGPLYWNGPLKSLNDRGVREIGIRMGDDGWIGCL